MQDNPHRIYWGLPDVDQRFAQAILAPLEGFQSSCARAFQLSDNCLGYAQEAIANFDAIGLVCNRDILGVVSPIFSWETLVLSLRVVDRSVALLAALNEEFECRHPEIQPFAASILNGTGLLRSLIQKIKATASGTGKKLFASGPILDLAHGRPVDFPLYDRSGAEDFGRSRILAGVVSDNLDLFCDVLAAAEEDNFASYNVKRLWGEATRLPFVESRGDWDCGNLYDEHAFRKVSGLTAQRFKKMLAGGELLAVPWWDGRLLFPEIQLQDAPKPRVFRYIKNLLRELSPNSKVWSLAIWLGQVDEGGYQRRIAKLASKEGFDELLALLQPLGAVATQKAESFVPALKDEVRSSFQVGMFTELSGAKTSVEAYLKSGSEENNPIGPAKKLYRVTRRQNSPLYFSFTATYGSGGRFDLVEPTDRGTCYFAGEAMGAISEIFGQVVMVDVQDMANRYLWTATVLGDRDKLADLTDSSKSFPVSSVVHSSMDRKATQQLACAIHSAGFQGIKHNIKTTSGLVAYALFGKKGVSSGEDGWLLSKQKMSESPDFWAWIQSRKSRSGVRTALFMQFPFDEVPVSQPGV